MTERTLYRFSAGALTLLLTLTSSGIASAALPVPRKSVIVLFRAHVQEQVTQALLQRGADIRYIHHLIPAISAEIPIPLLDVLRREPAIQNIFEDMRVQAFLDESVPQIRADTAQASGITGEGMRVCIVDTGVDDSHPSLPTLVSERDFVNGDQDAFDDHGHGSHVAGIIASQHAIYRGVAPGASLMAAKVLDESGFGNSSDVIAGIEWCVENGADAINMSLGGKAFASACDDDPLAQAGNAATEQGVTVLAASGNSGNTNGIATPACGSQVLAIGAVDTSDQIASYSNGGSQLDVVAPGSSINSTVPGGGFQQLSGTSMATPHAAGTVALILQANPALTPAQVRSILRDTALDLGPSGFDFAYGYGRIDANAAILAAPGNTPPPSPALLFSDDFESGFGKWTESNEFDWNVESPAERQVPGHAAANRVAHADQCGSAQGCILTMANSLDLSSSESVTVRFQRYVDRSIDAGEFLRIEAFNGTNWGTLRSWTNGDGDDDTWREESLALPAQYLVATFRLRFTSRESSALEETEIDDVEVSGVGVQSTMPTADAGPDQTVSDGDADGAESVTLDGSASSDPGGSIVGYEWREGTVVLGTSSVLTADFPLGTHTVTLTVTDNDGETDTDSAVITVLPNQVPTANAGPDQTIADSDNDGAAVVTLDGSASSDPDGSIVSFLWKEGGTELGTTAILTLPLPLGSHTIMLTVTDNAGTQASDTVLVTVEPPPPPPPPTQLLFSDDFQSGSFSLWEESGLPEWNVESPSEQQVPGKDSTNLVAHADRCNNPGGCVLTLRDALDLSPYSAVILRFYRFVDSSLDPGEFLEVQAFDGTSWKVLRRFEDGAGDDDTWHPEELSLPSSFLGTGFRLRFVSRESASFEDTEIDDVLLEFAEQ